MRHRAGVTAVVLLLVGCPVREVPVCESRNPPDSCFEDGGDGDDVGSSADVTLADVSGRDAPGDVGACGGACGSDEVCDPVTSTCVECLGEEDCVDPTPACDLENNVCVACTDAMDDACTVNGQVCDTESNACVECVENEDCTDPAASRCVDNVCSVCESSDDCGHLTAGGICTGAGCVECTVEDESPCGGNSCDPATNTCTETPLQSVGTCEFCLADSECAMGYRCVPMEFQGTPRNGGVGGYCLREFDMMPCSLPYKTPITRESVSGAPAEQYCGIVEDATTCEAVLDLAAEVDCANDDDCGADGLDDGRCEDILAEMKCTYSCTSDAECTAARPCGGADPMYCGG